MKRTLRTRVAFAALALALASTAQADMKDVWTAVAQATGARAAHPARPMERGAGLVQQAIERASQVPNGNGGLHPGNGSSGSPNQRREAAVAMAAFAVLERLYPEAQADLEVRLAISLAELPETDAKAEGLLIGRSVAAEVLGRE